METCAKCGALVEKDAAVATKKGHYCDPCWNRATDIYDYHGFDEELYQEFREHMAKLTTPDLPPMHASTKTWPLPNPFDDESV